MRHIVCWVQAKKLFTIGAETGPLLVWSFEGLDELQIAGKEVSRINTATWAWIASVVRRDCWYEESLVP
jgi:hypothetical protein